MATPADEEWYPHFADSPSDYGMLILTVAGGPASLVYTAYDTSRKMYTGEYSSRDSEAAAFRLGTLSGLTGAAWGVNRYTTGAWGKMPQASRAIGAWMAHGAPMPGWARAGLKIGGMYLAAFELYGLFMDPDSRFYIPPDAPLFSFSPDSVIGVLDSAIWETVVDLYESAL